MVVFFFFFPPPFLFVLFSSPLPGSFSPYPAPGAGMRVPKLRGGRGAEPGRAAARGEQLGSLNKQLATQARRSAHARRPAACRALESAPPRDGSGRDPEPSRPHGDHPHLFNFFFLLLNGNLPALLATLPLSFSFLFFFSFSLLFFFSLIVIFHCTYPLTLGGTRGAPP